MKDNRETQGRSQEQINSSYQAFELLFKMGMLVGVIAVLSYTFIKIIL